jgi:hypothetical protein
VEKVNAKKIDLTPKKLEIGDGFISYEEVFMPDDQIIKFEHIVTLFDVVFGVVIGLALLKLPDSVLPIITAIKATTLKSAFPLLAPLLLLISAFVFSFFYWIENRHFISQEQKFNKAIADEHSKPPALHPGFVLGGLFMIMLAAASLVFAERNLFRPFLVANLAFWVCDFIGTSINRRTYKPFDRIARKSWDDYGWFWGHIGTSYFQFYGAGNIIVFVVALLGDYLFAKADLYQFITAFALLLLTILRHVRVRSNWYNSWLQRRYRERFVKK